MEIIVNGKLTSTRAATLAEYLAERRKSSTRAGSTSRVVVEYNGRIVPAKEWAETILAPQDRLEIVAFVGGG